MSRNQNPHRVPSGPSAPAQVQLVTRISPAVYEALAAKCKPLNVSNPTTEIEVAFALGQQSVLKFLREDLVVGV